MKNIFKVALLLIFSSFPVFADVNQDITNFVNNFAKKFESIENIEIQKKKEVETFILSRQILDFSWMGNYILGRHRKTISEEKVKQFVEEYSKFLIRNYLSVLHYYTGNNYKILSIEETKDKTYMVSTSVKYKDNKFVKNNFRIIKKNGKYYITDIITEGISFINAQRSEVNSLITSKGFDKFLEELKAKNESK